MSITRQRIVVAGTVLLLALTVPALAGVEGMTAETRVSGVHVPAEHGRIVCLEGADLDGERQTPSSAGGECYEFIGGNWKCMQNMGPFCIDWKCVVPGSECGVYVPIDCPDSDESGQRVRPRL